MQTNCKSPRAKFLEEWKNNASYFDMLSLVSSLSKLFSESSVPYLDYRIAENLFCKYYNAINDARSCTAYDARLDLTLGIGIKTFIISKGSSMEKVAEFNKLRPKLQDLKGKDLAKAISNFRNERIQFSIDTYGIQETLYHIVGRKERELHIFNVPYDKIDIVNISGIVDKENTLLFNDGKDEYSFNKSKSVLLKRFESPSLRTDVSIVPVEILDEPLDLLKELLLYRDNKIIDVTKTLSKGVDYVVLPLYSQRGGNHVPKKSGLNQWNARGRSRNPNEIYIPIPVEVRKRYPNFFPNKEISFELILPDNSSLSAKVCQEDGKALMSNPNAALGEWLLRRILKKNEGELVTMDDLNLYGIDSVQVTSLHKINEDGLPVYKIEFLSSGYETYSEFINH